MLPETIYCYEINFIVTSKSRALMKQLIVIDQLWHLVRMPGLLLPLAVVKRGKGDSASVIGEQGERGGEVERG